MIAKNNQTSRSRMNQDLEHLKLLSVLHYVVAAMVALFACFPLIHVFFGLMFILAPQFFDGDKGPPFPAALFGFMFVFVGGILVVAGWALAITIFLGGRRLAERRSYTFCLVVAGLSCLFMPVGTVLGVFTIIVLMRPSAKELFR